MPRGDRRDRSHLRIVRAGEDGGETPPPQVSDALLRYAATRAAEQPFYVASVLKEYRDAMDLDENALADELGCAGAGIARLGLCRAPDPSSIQFRRDVEAIAAHAGVRLPALVRILRYVDAARAMRGAEPDADVLLAARDRVPEPEDGTPEPPETKERHP